MGEGELLASIAVVVTGLGGIYIAIHETRRRERKTVRKELNELVEEVDTLQHLLLEQRRWIYKAAMILADHGIDVPRPPAPSFDKGEYDNDEHDDWRKHGDT